ncbi:hypothetical protein QUW15_11805, partial [Desulfovibrio piger]|nr:hypothetical protein [Desulfovibrio piger]
SPSLEDAKRGEELAAKDLSGFPFSARFRSVENMANIPQGEIATILGKRLTGCLPPAHFSERQDGADVVFLFVVP